MNPPAAGRSGDQRHLVVNHGHCRDVVEITDYKFVLLYLMYFIIVMTFIIMIIIISFKINV